MRLQNFQEEEIMIRKEIDGTSHKNSQLHESKKSSPQFGSHQHNSSQPPKSEEQLGSQRVTKSHGLSSKVPTTRRLIRIDDIEIVQKLPGWYIKLCSGKIVGAMCQPAQ